MRLLCSKQVIHSHKQVTCQKKCKCRDNYAIIVMVIICYNAGETYEDWCRVIQSDRMKENNLRPEMDTDAVNFVLV